jgi:hypothetical protein
MTFKQELIKMVAEAQKAQWGFIKELCMNAARSGESFIYVDEDKVPGRPTPKELEAYLELDVVKTPHNSGDRDGCMLYKISWISPKAPAVAYRGLNQE